MREEPRRGRGDDGILARPGRRELSALAFSLEALVSFSSFPLVSGNKTKSRKGGIRILKMRLYAQGQTLDTGAQKNKSHARPEKGGGQRGWTRNMLEPAKRGHGGGFRVSLLANCRIAVWAPNQRHPTAAAALRACHRATEPPQPPTRADVLLVLTTVLMRSRQTTRWEMGNAKCEMEATRLGREQSISVRGQDAGKLGAPRPLHGSSPTTPP